MRTGYLLVMALITLVSMGFAVWWFIDCATWNDFDEE